MTMQSIQRKVCHVHLLFEIVIDFFFFRWYHLNKLSKSDVINSTMMLFGVCSGYAEHVLQQCKVFYLLDMSHIGFCLYIINLLFMSSTLNSFKNISDSVMMPIICKSINHSLFWSHSKHINQLVTHSTDSYLATV